MIARGLTYSQAAEAAGLHRDTLADWEATKPEFSDALKRANANGIDRRLARIEKAAVKGNWQADAWWLERNCPQQWGRRLALAVPEEQPEPGKDIDMEHIDRFLLSQFGASVIKEMEKHPGVTAETLVALKSVFDLMR